VEVYAPRILDLGIRWRWVITFTLRPLYFRGRAPGSNWIWGWVVPRTVLDAVVKRKIPRSPWKAQNLARLGNVYNCTHCLFIRLFYNVVLTASLCSIEWSTIGCYCVKSLSFDVSIIYTTFNELTLFLTSGDGHYEDKILLVDLKHTMHERYEKCIQNFGREVWKDDTTRKT
jgi:hypothetical protein